MKNRRLEKLFTKNNYDKDFDMYAELLRNNKDFEGIFRLEVKANSKTKNLMVEVECNKKKISSESELKKAIQIFLEALLESNIIDVD